MATRFEPFRREPYRWLFPVAVLMAIGGVGHWLFYAIGWMTTYSSLMHAAIQVQLYLGCILSGFLMTAIPRFSETPQAKVWEGWGAALLVTAVTAAIFVQSWIWAHSLFILWLVFLARFIFTRFMKRKVAYPPAEFAWIAPAFLFGTLGGVVMILYFAGILGPEWMSVGRSLQEQGLMLALVLGVGGFLGPRLMGVHRVPFGQAKPLADEFRRKIRAHLACAVVLGASFLAERWVPVEASYGLRALVVVFVMMRTRSLNAQILKGPSLFIRLLSTSFWLIAAGYVLIAFIPAQRAALLHLVFLGGFSLMIFCITTMVTLNHAGRGDLMQKPLWILRLGGAGLLAALLLRVLAGAFPERFFLLLGASAAIWLATAVSWLVFSAAHLFAGGGDHRHHRPDAC